MDSYAKLKNNLVKIRDNYYLSQQDPFFWRKLLRWQSDNAEAMYHVALEVEEEAKEYLKRYQGTKNERYLTLYQRKIKEAYHLFKKSLNLGYLLSRKEVIRLEEEMSGGSSSLSQSHQSLGLGLNIAQNLGLNPGQNQNLGSSLSKNKSQRTQGRLVAYPRHVMMILTIILVLLFLIIMLLLFSRAKVFAHNTTLNNNFALMIPYQVVDGLPVSLPNQDYISKSIELSQAATRQDIINSLVDAVKTGYQMDNTQPEKITAIAKENSNKELGMAIWGGGSSNIAVYVFPLTASQSSHFAAMVMATTVIRSALYQYVKRNGSMPKTLAALTMPFPKNYLTSLPKEPNSLSNKVVSAPDDTGGWIYHPIDMAQFEDITDSNLNLSIKNALQPNVPNGGDIPFSPLELYVNKEKHSLDVVADNQVVKQYTVAVGSNNSTPEGKFYIDKKVVNPNKKTVPNTVFGTRGMELSSPSYAIHGTNNPVNIGKDTTAGCIGMNNQDIDELYALTPLYTTVDIAKGSPLEKANVKADAGTHITPNAISIEDKLYDQSDKPTEEDNSTIYHWN